MYSLLVELNGQNSYNFVEHHFRHQFPCQFHHQLSHQFPCQFHHHFRQLHQMIPQQEQLDNQSHLLEEVEDRQLMLRHQSYLIHRQFPCQFHHQLSHQFLCQFRHQSYLIHRQFPCQFHHHFRQHNQMNPHQEQLDNQSHLLEEVEDRQLMFRHQFPCQFRHQLSHQFRHQFPCQFRHQSCPIHRQNLDRHQQHNHLHFRHQFPCQCHQSCPIHRQFPCQFRHRFPCQFRQDINQIHNCCLGYALHKFHQSILLRLVDIQQNQSHHQR